MAAAAAYLDDELSEKMTTVTTEIKPTDVSPDDKMTVSTHVDKVEDAASKIVDSKPRSKSLNDLSCNSDAAPSEPEPETTKPETTKPKTAAASSGSASFEEESNEHLYPSVVDTAQVDGSIIQVRCKFNNFSNSLENVQGA